MNIKFSANLKTTTAIAIMILIFSILISTMPVQAQAQITGGAPQSSNYTGGPLPTGVTPNDTIETIAYLSVSPNPIGVGQLLLVNMWLQPPVIVNRVVVGYNVVITKPDGTKDTIGPLNSYQGDATNWFTYLPQQAGNYTFQLFYAGTYYPAGYYNQGIVYSTSQTGGSALLQSAYYLPSNSAVVKLTVQADPVASWPPSTLPTDYWSRPISPNNREWWVIAGNFPFSGIGGGANWPAYTNIYESNYKFVPYVQAPTSAHVLWRQQFAIGGLIGGTQGQTSVSMGIVSQGVPHLIYDGRCYETLTKVMPQIINGSIVNQPASVWECFDLQTGQVYWDQTGITQPPTFITYGSSSPSVPGATSGETSAIYLVYIGSSRLVEYDPYTGAVVVNVSIPVTSGTVYADPWVLSIQTIGTGAATQYYLINWTVTGTSTNFATRVNSNVSYPFSTIGTADFESMIAVNTASITPSATGTAQGQILMGSSLVTGKLLWNVSTSVTASEIFFASLTFVADHGKFAARMDDGYIEAWDLKTGAVAWKTLMPTPWGEFGVYDVYSAYGLLYSNAYDGVRALNWTNGNIEWTYQSDAVPFETPYTNSTGSDVYSFSAPGYVADGKIYTFNCEHTPSEPLTRGWKLYCINATTGAGIWNITFMSLGQNGPGARGFQGAIAGGYLAYINEYDGYLYVFGKGQCVTSVSAPQTAITSGTPAIISGTVMDQSPAQSGTPAVSDASMGTYMEYLHMQQPIDGLFHNTIVTGVPVSIDAVDPNQNYIHIADTTSDVSGLFSYTWTPTLAGDYKIYATFAGSGSYGSSYAETAAHVVNAPATTSTPTQTTQTSAATATDVMAYTVAAAVAIIIAIAIVGLLLLRKK